MATNRTFVAKKRGDFARMGVGDSVRMGVKEPKNFTQTVSEDLATQKP